MTNYKEILRLYCSRDYSLRGIAKALGISRNTVNKCLDRVFELQMKLPIPESMTNEELRLILFPQKRIWKIRIIACRISRRSAWSLRNLM